MNAYALKILRATKLLLALPAMAQAQYYYTNGLDIWSYTPNTGPVTITGYSGPRVALVIPSTINGYTVTGIGFTAFYDNTSLTSVTIPGSVTSIGDYAFEYCANLSSLSLSNGVTSLGVFVFAGCTSLTSVTIPDSVTSLGDEAFEECTHLTSVTIGNSVTSIGDGAFAGTSLTSITIPHSVTSIGDDAFAGTSLTSVTIPDSATSIGEVAFDYCTSLTTATIGNGVTSLGDSAFYECFSLTNVTIGSSVTSIGDDAFFLCDSLSSITIPDSVTNIGQEAFIYCDYLTNVFIPAGVMSIGDGAFFECFSLTAIDVDAANENYSSVDGVLFDKNQDTLIQCPCSKDGNYAIPLSVTNIDIEAFDECFLLTKVTVPNSVTSIGESTFSYCDDLTNVTMGSGITSIGANAFESCYSLPSITIGSGVTSIGSYAFADCDSLSTVYFQGNSPAPTNDLSVFQGDTTGIVYYHSSTTGWGTLFDGWPTMPYAASSGIGNVDQIVGNVTVTHPDGSTTTLQLGDSIQMGDIVNTAAGATVHIEFIDNTSIQISENAKLAIDEYVYDPNSKAGNSSVSILRGTFQYVSGLIGPNNPGGENLQTAYGYTGIRGTQFIVQQDPCSSTEMIYLIQGELAITPLDTPGVTNICDAPVTISVTTSSVTTASLDQTMYDSVSNQVFQNTGIVTFGSWLEQYFDCTNDPDAAPTADPSGDGQDNYTKFLAGMNPTNPASYFHILSATPKGKDMLVSWMCGGGRTNVLQTTTNPGGTWCDVSPNIVLAGSGDSVTNYLDVGAVTNSPARFYRVQLVQ